jgi:hypothetical protein
MEAIVELDLAEANWGVLGEELAFKCLTAHYSPTSTLASCVTAHDSVSFANISCAQLS